MKTTSKSKAAPGLSLAFELDTPDWWTRSPAFTPDSRTLVIPAHKHETVIMEMESWTMRTVPKPTFETARIAFSPDSEHFILNTFNCEPLQCWQTKTGTPRWALDPGSMEAEFSPDGKLVAATRGKSVLICDAGSGQIIHSMAGHKSRVDYLRFSPAGDRIATVGQSQVCLWDVKKRALITVVQQKKGELHALTFSSDGRSLAVGGLKGVIFVYDAYSGIPLHEWAASTGHTWHLDFASDGTRLMDFLNFSRLWELPSCRQIYQASTGVGSQFICNRTKLMVTTKTAMEVRDLNGTLEVSLPLKTKMELNFFQVSPDLRWLMCSDGERIEVWKIAGLA